VQLVRQLADGGTPRPVPNAERSGCYCTRGAMQGYDVVLFIVVLEKTPDMSGQAVTPGGSAPIGSGPLSKTIHPISCILLTGA
jgi:hypothetical protein